MRLHSRLIHAFLGTLCTAVVAGAGNAQPASTSLPVLPEWQAPLARAHPLTGRIVRLDDGATIDPTALVDALARSDFILLGEKHDNPDHHAIQAWVVKSLAQAGRRPGVAFEQLDSDQAPALAQYLARDTADAAGLGQAVGWEARGWPDWSMYAPIAVAALGAGLPIVAADLSKEAQRAIGRGIGLAAERHARLGLDVTFDAAQSASLSNELDASHCGHLPASAIPRMMDVQRARDAHMAATLVDAARLPGTDGAVLIAGVGHVRRDRGVPWHLTRLAPDRSVASVALVEVDPDRTAPSDYDPGPFDYAWFTPRVDDDDPCAKFAEQLRRMHKR